MESRTAVPWRSPLAWALVATLLAGASGLLQPLDRAVQDLGVSLTQHAVESDLVIVEIDAASLGRLEGWPWPRRYHAEVLDRLRESGAETIFYDVDFSAPSAPVDDRLLADALGRFPSGAVMLPAFIQPENSAGADPAVASLPLPALRAGTLLASVNVHPDPDGLVRRVPLSQRIGEEVAVLAGARMSDPTGTLPSQGSVPVDWSIDPRSLPRLSFKDVLDGRFDRARVSGRKVFVGATAIELGDLLPVPVHGALPGVVVQALAYHTVSQSPLRTAPWLLEAAVALLALAAMAAIFPRLGWRGGLLVVAVAILLVIGSAILLHAGMRIATGLAMPLTLLVAGYACSVVSRLEHEIAGRRRQRELLKHQARHDALTGLGNRYFLNEELERRLGAERKDGRGIALLMIDLDKFKEINDALGHDTGDEVLRQVACRFGACLRDEDAAIARIGGDEFAVILTDDAQLRRGKAIAARLLEVLDRPIPVQGIALEIGGSIGVALYPTHALDAASLMREADTAMYVAKRSGSGVAVYEPAYAERNALRMAISTGLRRAIAEDGLSLCYQPKLDIAHGTVIGAEALLRWEHPGHGFIPPEDVIDVAEGAGMIWAVTEWTLRRALADARTWRNNGPRLKVAVNLSARLLQDQELPLRIIDCLARHQFDPGRLILEITESAIMADPRTALRNALALRAAGIELSIDDFGTGYSSLAYLRDLPATELKLDKSFVTSMLTEHRNALIVKSTLDLAHGLGLRLVAEGVESLHVLGALHDLGCDLAQGYYVSRPLPPERFESWLRNPGNDLAKDVLPRRQA